MLCAFEWPIYVTECVVVVALSPDLLSRSFDERGSSIPIFDGSPSAPAFTHTISSILPVVNKQFLEYLVEVD
jgi:hypothetical protein